MQPEKPIRILGIAGSLRKNSFNKQLLQAATKLLPKAAQLELFGIDDIPLYNQDVEVSGIPEAVKRFKERIESADAILIATPEYNHSYPGILKNAIDWGSRPYGQNSFNGKPVAVISASPGTFGGVGAQDQLKQVLLALNMHLVSQPAVIVTSAHDKIDSDGNLTDPITTQFFTQLLANLVEFTRKFYQPVKPLLAPTISKR
ncbi:MAG: NAD(P)H-dependent oxidoreductase [Candidatus Bathyarchaeia archaeon]